MLTCPRSGRLRQCRPSGRSSGSFRERVRPTPARLRRQAYTSRCPAPAHALPLPSTWPCTSRQIQQRMPSPFSCQRGRRTCQLQPFSPPPLPDATIPLLAPSPRERAQFPPKMLLALQAGGPSVQKHRTGPVSSTLHLQQGNNSGAERGGGRSGTRRQCLSTG